MSKNNFISPGVDENSATLARILESALEQFSKCGYEGASIREIALASEVSKPTLYYYFRNKEALYRELAGRCFQEILDDLTEASQVKGSTISRLLEMVCSYTRLCETKPNLIKFVYFTAMLSGENTPQVDVRSFVQDESQIISLVVDEAVSRNEILPNKAPYVLHALYGFFHLNASHEILWGKKNSIKNVEGAIRCLLDGAVR